MEIPLRSVRLCILCALLGIPCDAFLTAPPSRPFLVKVAGNSPKVILESTTDNEVVDTLTEETKRPAKEDKKDFIQETFKKLATWSLQDYEWRSSVFKANEADRMLEQSLARMRGEEASYVRPMDAGDGRLGPLGEAERSAVNWLSSVIEEEGRRAERIARSEGVLVRPMDASEKGPLAALERQAVDFFNSIFNSEMERLNTFTLRPKDLDHGKRGPLGEAEAKISDALAAIRESEMLRRKQSEMRGGARVRPIDVPGPVGEFEKAVGEIVRAEQQRIREAQEGEDRVIRPKDAKLKGPLGEAELEAINSFQRLAEEERERLRNIQRVLEENRPMESDQWSFWGFAESFVVGLLRGPQLLMSVADRVQELMKTATLDSDDDKYNLSQFMLKMPKDDDDKNGV